MRVELHLHRIRQLRVHHARHCGRDATRRRQNTPGSLQNHPQRSNHPQQERERLQSPPLGVDRCAATRRDRDHSKRLGEALQLVGHRLLHAHRHSERLAS